MEKASQELTLNQYQQKAVKTLASYDDPKLAIAVMSMGLAGEAGEVVDLLKKVVGHGHELDLEKVEKEIGDVLWYVASLADVLGLSLEDIAEKNLIKLSKRYPKGFSSERSINREEYSENDD